MSGAPAADRPAPAPAAVASPLRILFITANRLGDVVLSTGLLGWLVERHAGARVTIACGPAGAGLFAALPGLDAVVDLDKRRFGGHWWSLWTATVPRRWDLVVDLRNSAVSLALRARRRIIRHGRRDDRVHVVEELGRLVGAAPPPAPRLWLDPATTEAAGRRMAGDGPILAVSPTANWRGKEWRQERFAALVRRLTAPGGPLAGHRLAVFGGPGERARAAPVIEALASDRVIDLVGRTDPALAAACLARARLHVGLDSGLTHLAAAAGGPTLALFGPGWPARYRPWGPNAAVVTTPDSVEQMMARPGYDHRTTDTLMDGLTVDRVADAVADLVDRLAPAADGGNGGRDG